MAGRQSSSSTPEIPSELQEIDHIRDGNPFLKWKLHKLVVPQAVSSAGKAVDDLQFRANFGNTDAIIIWGEFLVCDEKDRGSLSSDHRLG